MSDQQMINVTDSNVKPVNKVLYTANVHVSGGRDGLAQSNDGRLDIKLTSPGSKGEGTNPEQLFAAGWSACFIGALKHCAAAKGLTLPEDVAIDAQVDLATGDDGFQLQARLHVALPGFAEEDAVALAEAAHQTCPYSKATRGNINVQINVAI